MIVIVLIRDVSLCRGFFSFHRITFFFLLFIFVMLSVDWHHPFSRRIMDLFGDNGPSIFFIISLRCYKMPQYYSHPHYFPSFLVNLVQLIVSQSYIIPLPRICESRNYSRSNFSSFPISFLFILERVSFQSFRYQSFSNGVSSLSKNYFSG